MPNGEVKHFFSIGVQGDGYIYYELGLYDNGAAILVSETTTTLQVKKGWNYVGMMVDEIYEYSYVTMYLRNEWHTAFPYFSKYETFFKGYYEPGSDSSLNDDVMVLGCRTM